MSCLFFPHQFCGPSLFASLLFPPFFSSLLPFLACRITVTARSGDPDIVASSDFEFPIGVQYRNYTWSSSQYSSDEIIISKDFPCKAIIPSTLVSSTCNPATSYQPGRGKPVYIGRQGNSDYCGSDLTHSHTHEDIHKDIHKTDYQSMSTHSVLVQNSWCLYKSNRLASYHITLPYLILSCLISYHLRGVWIL